MNASEISETSIEGFVPIHSLESWFLTFPKTPVKPLFSVEDNNPSADWPDGKRFARVKSKVELDCAVARRNTRTSTVSESVDNDALSAEALAKTIKHRYEYTKN